MTMEYNLGDKTSFVSVIVPVYKVEKYLDECVRSILAQTYRNIEVILVDDGSPDSCPQLCDAWVKADGRVRVVHKPNGGLSSARNAGIDVAKGDYLMFIDSDDVIKPEMVEEMLASLLRNDAEVCCSRLVPWGGNREFPCVFSEETVLSDDDALCMFLERTIETSSCTKLYRRKAVGDVRFIEGRINEDFPFLSSVFSKTQRVVYLPEGYYLYRYTPGSISTTFRESYFDCLKNVADVGRMIADNGRIRESFDICRMRAEIDAAFMVVRHGAHARFREQLKGCRGYIKSNLLRIFRNGRVGLNYKVKALLAFAPFKLPI